MVTSLPSHANTEFESRPESLCHTAQQTTVDLIGFFLVLIFKAGVCCDSMGGKVVVTNDRCDEMVRLQVQPLLTISDYSLGGNFFIWASLFPLNCGVRY